MEAPDFMPHYLETPEISEPYVGYTLKTYSDGVEVCISPDGAQTKFYDGSVTVERKDRVTYSSDHLKEQPCVDFG